MKISKQSLEDQAANLLRKQILTGVYHSGDRLVESSLAKSLELSRSTIRMALNTLASEGLIYQKPYAGWQVITLQESDLREIYHLRAALEPEAAKMAAECINDEGRQRLTQLFDSYKDLCEQPSADAAEASLKDLALHRLIVELSGSQRMVKMYNMLANQLVIYMHMTHYDYSVEDSALCHQPLVEAICAGDQLRAGQLAGENISTFAELEEKSRRH